MNNKQYIESINTIIESVIIDLMNKEQIKTATFLRLRINNYIDIFNKHIQIEDASKGYILDILQDLIIDKLEDIKRTEEVKELKEIMEDYFLTTMKEDEQREEMRFKERLRTYKIMAEHVKNILIEKEQENNDELFNSIKEIIEEMEKIAKQIKEYKEDIKK